jgi:hypothetical protein
MMTKLRENWGILWQGTRWPLSRRGLKVTIAAWACALLVAAVTVAGNLITKDYGWLWWNLIVALFDFVMLHRSIEGYAWRTAMDEAAERMRRL